MKIRNINAIDIAVALTALVGLLTSCGKPIPVKELANARAEIEEARLVKAEEFSAEKYKQAREALLSAHKLLVDEKMSEAGKKANEARSVALKAREESAPKFTAREKEQTEASLKEAEEAYAEVLAKDDFQAARKLYQDGTTLNQQAAAKEDDVANLERQAAALKNESDAKKREQKMTVIIKKRHAVLRIFLNADKKYRAAREAARRAKNVALAQKDDLLDSLSGVESMLRRAESYGADKSVPELYKNAKREVARAKRRIKEGKLKKGNSHILRAEELAKAVLNSALDKYAKRKLEEAKQVVGKSDEDFQKETDGIRNAAARKKIVRARETLNAAKEALSSAEKNYGDRKYEDSAKDSEEAIRLAKIVNEQRDAIAMIVKKRSTGRTGRTGKRTGPGKKGWKRYVVRKRRPADCLWRIAAKKRHYGNRHLWRKIYRANRDKIKNPHLIYPGQVFWIPPRSYRGGRVPSARKPKKKKKSKKPGEQPRENIED